MIQPTEQLCQIQVIYASMKEALCSSGSHEKQYKGVQFRRGSSITVYYNIFNVANSIFS